MGDLGVDRIAISTTLLNEIARNGPTGGIAIEGDGSVAVIRGKFVYRATDDAGEPGSVIFERVGKR